MRKVFLFLTTVFFLVTMLAAQYAQIFNYKAVARDKSGNPIVNRTIGFKVSIYQGDPDGPEVYCETHQITSNQFGLVEIRIGDGVVWSGVYSALDWQAYPYFVKIEMDPDGGEQYEVLGTSQLISVPYAIYPETSIKNQPAGILNEKEALPTVDEEYNSRENAGYRNNTDLSNINSTTSPYWEITVNDDIYYNDGKVGIGTSSPQGNFHVSTDELTGTGTISSSGTAVTGGGTAFKTQLFIGGEITASAETKTIVKITNNTSLEVDSAWSSDISGQSFTYKNPDFIVGTNGLLTLGRAVIDSLTGNKIELGTLDPFSRSQIWNYLPDSVLRLGSLTADGDAQIVSSEGIVVYGKNVQGEPMIHTDWSYARIKPDRIGINNCNDGSQFYIFRIDGSDNDFYLKDNSGNTTFDFDRLTGDLDLAGTITVASGKDVCIEGGNCLSSLPPCPCPAGNNGEIQFNSSGSCGANSNLFWDNTNSRLGIGTNTPTETLDVDGNLYMSGGDILTDRWIQRDSNTFLGLEVVGAGNLTGGENYEGCGNTALGFRALYSITTGRDNTSIGTNTLVSLTTGQGNTAVGQRALYYNTTGDSNTAVGRQTLYYNTTGVRNITVGSFALYINTEGTDNIALGKHSSYQNTTGNCNVAIGSSANYQNQTGGNNTIIGYEAGRGNSLHSKSGNVFIGYQAGYNETGSNKLYIENSNSSSPLIYGEFDNDILVINGKLGIGTTNPGYAVDVDGSVRADDFIESSDVRIKENVGELTGSLEKLQQLHPVMFEFTGEYKEDHKDCEGVKMGFIAQEVKEVIPEIVSTTSKKVGDRIIEDFHVLSTHRLTPMLVDAVQELKTENDRLKVENQKLQNRLDKELKALKLEIEALKEKK